MNESQPTCKELTIIENTATSWSLMNEIDNFNDSFVRLKRSWYLSISTASIPELLRVFKSNLRPSGG